MSVAVVHASNISVFVPMPGRRPSIIMKVHRMRGVVPQGQSMLNIYSTSVVYFSR